MAKWAQIAGYPNYLVSDSGEIMRADCVIQTKGGARRLKRRIRSNRSTNGRYSYITLAKGGIRKNFYIHRLVAQAFIPNPNNLPCVNHKNYDPLDNRVSNLEWCTHKDNARYSALNMRKPHQTKAGVTGEKYISLCEGRYRVSIRRTGCKTIDRRFETLEQAVDFRDAKIKEMEEYASTLNLTE